MTSPDVQTWRRQEYADRRRQAVVRARMAGFEDPPRPSPKRIRRRRHREIAELLRWLLSTKLSTYPQSYPPLSERDYPRWIGR